MTSHPHRAPVIGARTIRAARSTLRNTRRALLTMRPTWAPLLAAVIVVTPTAAAVATWATLPPTGDALHLPRVQMALGATSVDAASGEATAAEEGAPTATADPRLQPTPPGAPMLEYAAPGGPDHGTRPGWLPDGLTPWWPDIVAAAHEHGLDSHAWGAVIAIECPMGVNSRPAPSCQYNNASRAGGLAQITDDTAVGIAAQSGLPCATQKFDPVTSLRCGAFHFADLLRAGGAYWRPDDELPAIQLAAIAYNSGAGSSAYSGARAAVAAGGDACAGIPGGFDPQTARYCRMIADFWGQTMAERAADPTAPRASAPWRDPFGPRVAPGVPVPYLEAHLEAGR